MTPRTTGHVWLLLVVRRWWCDDKPCNKGGEQKRLFDYHQQSKFFPNRSVLRRPIIPPVITF